MRRLLLAAGATALAAAPGCGSGGKPGSKTKTTRTQGRGAAPAKPASRRGRSVKAIVSRGDGGAIVVVPVRLAGREYGFVVDTGASQSSIDVRAARRAELKQTGKRQTQTTLGCATSSQPVRIPDWSLSGIPLPPTTATAQETDLAKQSKGKVVGLLGSDVLSHFGRVAIDYHAARLTLGGPAPRGGRSFAARVIRLEGQTLVGAKAVVHGRRLPFLIDTGASSSTIDSRVAQPLGLRSAGRMRSVSAVNCRTKIQPVRLDRWRVGAVELPGVAAASQRSALFSQAIAGLIGGDVFSHAGRVSIDFRTGKVTLG